MKKYVVECDVCGHRISKHEQDIDNKYQDDPCNCRLLEKIYNMEKKIAELKYMNKKGI